MCFTQDSKKAIVYVGETFIYGMSAEESQVDLAKIEEFLKSDQKNQAVKIATKKKLGVSFS